MPPIGTSTIDVTLLSAYIANAKWETMDTLNSDHLPILTTYKSNINFSEEEIFIPKFKLYKANWAGFTNDCKTLKIDNNLNINTAMNKLTLEIL